MLSTEGDKMAIRPKLKEIIVEQLAVDPERVKAEASFIDDLGADSLDIVELVMAMEEEFDLEIPDEDAEKLRTVGDVSKYLRAKGKAFKNSGPQQ
jgi:acyl carrier protein